MSRSFKHNAVIKDSNRYEKKQANKRVRKVDISNGGNYKKAFDSWKISDYKFRFDKMNDRTKSSILNFIRK